MDFLNFFTIHVFKVKQFTADIPTELSCLNDLENPGQLPVKGVHGDTDYFVSIDFHKCFNIPAFEVEESIAGIPNKLPCMDDLKKLSLSPVQ